MSTSPHVFVTGATGAGKSTLLRDWLLVPAPRVLVLDQLGDWWAWPGAEVVTTLPAALRALARGAGRVVLTLEGATPKEVAGEWTKLAGLLAPPSPATAGLGTLCGGLVLVVDEADLMFPNGNTDPAWANVYRRGRHHQVALYAATQRPAAVDRLVTAMAGEVIACATHEPRDRAYLGSVWPPEVGVALDRLPRFGALRWRVAERTAELLASPAAGHYQVVETWADDGGGWEPVDDD